jgi:hypothetical protein
MTNSHHLTKRPGSLLFFTVAIITALISGISCGHETVKQQSNTQSVNIHDTLATVSFPDLLQLDTSYTWVDNNDTDCSSIRKIRYQNKKDSAHKESGFIDHTHPPRFRTYLTFSTHEHVTCIDRLDPESFSAQAKEFGYNIMMNERGGNPEAKQLIAFLYTNSKNQKIYVIGFFIQNGKDDMKISFHVLAFNQRNHIPIWIEVEKTMERYDTQFVRNCIETINNINIQ